MFVNIFATCGNYELKFSLKKEWNLGLATSWVEKFLTEQVLFDKLRFKFKNVTLFLSENDTTAYGLNGLTLYRVELHLISFTYDKPSR